MVSPGDTIGPYVIEAPLTEGGMGAVYRARNRVTGQLRALKLVKAELAQDMDFVDRFVREATIASQLRHANLVETLEPGIDGDTVFLPMELLHGETLSARMRRQRLSWSEAVAILVPIAEAVQLLHDRGIVHRDLKPANIFLASEDDREIPKVLDLGIARRLDDDEHTGTGLVIGSPYYMPLEQAEGRRDIDGRADQYALAVIAYEMITGRRPYESDDTQSALAKLLRGESFLPPSRIAPQIVSPAIEQAILRGLHRDRAQRFSSVRELARALSASSPPEMGAARSPALELNTLIEAPRRRARMSLPLMLAIGGAASVVVATGVFVGSLRIPPERAAQSVRAPTAQVVAREPAKEPTETSVVQPTTIAEPPNEPRREDADVAPARHRARRAARRRAQELPCGALTGIPCR